MDVPLLAKWLGSLAGLVGRNAMKLSNSLLSDGQSYWWGNGRLTGAYAGGPAAGIDITQETAMMVATVFACTQARAETLASLPPMVYRETAENTRRRDSSNALWDLLHDSPNPEMDSLTFYELMDMRMFNRGNGFSEIVRDKKDRPIELWPIHNSRVEPFRDTNGGLQWRVLASQVDNRTDREFRYYTIPDRDMLNVVGFNSNGYIGSGVIPMAVEELSSNMAMTQFAGSWFKKGAHPSAVVEHEGYIVDPDERAEFRKDINSLHAGRENWHEVPVMWNGAKWKQIQFSPEQSQLIAGRGYSDKTICRYYKTPPAIVQIFDDYKFSTVDAMIQQFIMTCIRSDAIRFERAIHRKVMHTRNGKGKLIALFDNPYVFEFVIEALLRGDAKKQAETLEIERRNGIINGNEWRALSNREPLPGKQGEIYTVVGGFENLETLGNTYPKGNPGSKSSGSSSSGEDDQSTKGSKSLPQFSRDRLIAALESGVPKHRDRSPGASIAEATTVRDELDKAALEVLQEAVLRIESIAAKELAKAGDDEQKQQVVWSKHGSRLESAILPACNLYCKYRDKNAGHLAGDIAAHLSFNRLIGDTVSMELFEISKRR